MVSVLDRYTTSSLIYQSSVIDDIKKREEFIDYIYDYEYNKLGIPEPDLVIFLHAPFETIRELKAKRKDLPKITSVDFIFYMQKKSIFVERFMLTNIF